MLNFLEQLAAEWYEFQGFFVRRNVRVGKRAGGGYDGELDVVAFNPKRKSLVHVETSMVTNSWAEREAEFSRKFKMGREHIPGLFEGLEPLPGIESVALLGMGSAKAHSTVGGGRVEMVGNLLREIRDKIPHKVESPAFLSNT